MHLSLAWSGQARLLSCFKEFAGLQMFIGFCSEWSWHSYPLCFRVQRPAMSGQIALGVTFFIQSPPKAHRNEAFILVRSSWQAEDNTICWQLSWVLCGSAGMISGCRRVVWRFVGCMWRNARYWWSVVWCGGWVRKQTPSSNVIFFMGDRVDVSENSIIDRLSQPRTIASILVSKLGSSVNVWVVEPSHYKDSFACYENLLPSLSPSGEPSDYKPKRLPAARATLSLLQNCLTRVGQFLTCNPVFRSQVHSPMVRSFCVTQHGWILFHSCRLTISSHCILDE